MLPTGIPAGLFRPCPPKVKLKHAVVRFVASTRPLATVPTSGPDVNLVGQCNFDGNVETIQRRIPLASTIRLANSGASELREEFLRFFRLANHTQVAPSTVFPKQHEGSYFVNAGMSQFKPLFLQQTDHSASTPFANLRRATNSQPCIRIGGRLDDLNDVGYDRQHHTMFEMLGNWSFGDYYKKEACQYMWTFLTKVLGLPPNALYVTYFGGCPQHGLPPDDETRDIWLDLGVLDQKLLPFGMEHNFWRAGSLSGAGLCGPCTEIHVDFRALNGQEVLQCARCLINTASPQVMELWNSVFITHRLRPSEDESFKAELLEPLSKPFVDTGMGLERLCCVMQGVTSTYDTDVFGPLLELVHSEATISSSSSPSTSHQTKSYGGLFLPLCPHSSVDQPSDHPTETGDASVSSRLLPKLLHRLLRSSGTPKMACPPDNHHETVSSCDLHFLSGDDKDEELLSQWHRDIAYRLLTDHSRALTYALADGLLPGRQGLPLKLRQLIQRAVRAAVLTGLERERTGSSLLSSLVIEVAKQANLMEASVSTELQGPSARQPSSLSYEEMRSVIDHEVYAFIPRIHDMELAFGRCLEESPNTTQLSAQQVDGLMNGKYGTPVSWDLLCAQSRWFGLCIPDLPAQSRGSKASSRHSINIQQPVSLPRHFHNASIPFTVDSAKYNYTKSSDQSYVIPPCSSRLVGVVIPTSNPESYIVVNNKEDYAFHTQSVEWDVGRTRLLGLVFDHTNYFSPEGGQSGDTGFVHFGSKKLTIKYVQKISDPSNPSSGWVVHWSIVPEALLLDATLLWSDVTAMLHVDNERRLQLMQHHTGQHLFTWALDVYAHELRSRGLSATVQFHGGSVHPDRFVVDVAIVDPSASASTNDTESLHGIIQRVESFCRKIIEDRLPISVVSLPWSAVAEDHRIRRFPWVNYPNIVRAVRIGDWPSASALSATAELCCGTHLMSTADLVDLVVVSVRSRQQTTKQFTAIVGERARTTRLYGESLVADALARESNASKTELANHIDWILWIFHQTNPKHPNTQPLPIVARDLLEACLRRMKKGRVFTPSMPPVDETTSLADQIAELFERAHSSPLVAPVNFSRLDAVFKALVHLNPLNPGIFYNATIAVLFCPNATDIPGFSSLDVAKSIATRMSNSSLCGAIAIKARPLRSSANKGTAGRFKFALLELENPADSQWSSYHNLLESHFKDALLLLSSDTSDPLAKKA